jgi:hypothetical protein
MAALREFGQAARRVGGGQTRIGADLRDEMIDAIRYADWGTSPVEVTCGGISVRYLPQWGIVTEVGR